MDGMVVGREVRSDFEALGPFGKERVLLSHLSLHMRMGSIPFDSTSVRLMKLSADSGALLYGSHVESDPLKSSTCVVGFDGESWARRVDSQSPQSHSPSSYADLDLSAVDVFGPELLSRLSQQLSDPSLEPLLYYEPVLGSPVLVVLSEPMPSSISLPNRVLDGAWVEARREDTLSPVVRVFVDAHGEIWQEEYPTLTQIRRRIAKEDPSPLSSDLSVGLFSAAYLGNGSAADRATFTLRASPARLDALLPLGEASGHTFSRVSPSQAHLEVRAKAPDGHTPPVREDLLDTAYINPSNPIVVGALKYLRSAGKSGHLRRDRALNATALIAEISLLPSGKSLWGDPSKASNLLARYVSALLPNKEHTFSMVNAVTALEKGFGDCTEHSVLLASFLRAQGIPARLVSGMLLTRGGLWIYHMWNEYWDGATWQAIDAVRAGTPPDATYVAIGRGVSQFSDARAHLAQFIESAFSGVSFDLTAAWSEGISLNLARPRRFDLRGEEAAVLESLHFLGRGDALSALASLDSGVDPYSSTLSARLLRLELLRASGRCDEAIGQSAALRRDTSSRENLLSLGRVELHCFVSLGLVEPARCVLSEIRSLLPKNDPELDLFEAEILESTSGPAAARPLIDSTLMRFPDCAACLSAHVSILLAAKTTNQADLDTALVEALRLLDLNFWSDPEDLYVFASVLARRGELERALITLDHGLVLRPLDSRLSSLRSELSSSLCAREKPKHQ